MYVTLVSERIKSTWKTTREKVCFESLFSEVQMAKKIARFEETFVLLFHFLVWNFESKTKRKKLRDKTLSVSKNAGVCMCFTLSTAMTDGG